jgi:hypothetical protein
MICILFAKNDERTVINADDKILRNPVNYIFYLDDLKLATDGDQQESYETYNSGSCILHNNNVLAYLVISIYINLCKHTIHLASPRIIIH